jgi:hypothetical protein
MSCNENRRFIMDDERCPACGSKAGCHTSDCPQRSAKTPEPAKPAAARKGVKTSKENEESLRLAVAKDEAKRSSATKRRS